MANKSPVNWLTELSGIGLGAVAVLYICGYLAHTVYYRLMGIDVGAQPFTYLTFSGDYLISIFISIPQLFSLLFISYIPKIIEDWRWLGILFCLLSLLCLLLRRKRPRTESNLRKILACIFIGLACLTMILSELKVLRVQNVKMVPPSDSVCQRPIVETSSFRGRRAPRSRIRKGSANVRLAQNVKIVPNSLRHECA